MAGAVSALLLFPAPLSEGTPPESVMSATALAALRATRDFVVENPRTARRLLSACGHPGPIADLRLATLDEHTPHSGVADLLTPLKEGRDLGVLSEAGAPAVADPGALLVAAAHREGFRVVPFAGPSSIVLALMASGLEGQRFRFAGYLPVAATDRQAAILQLQSRSDAADETQVFIETPYRNDALLADLLRVCSPETRLAVAADLTGPAELIRMATIHEWRSRPGSIGKVPAIFLLQASPARRPPKPHPTAGKSRY